MSHEPEGALTAAQYEIMRIIWDSEPNGSTVTDVWQATSQDRPVGRTTLLNLVTRLENRGWLKRVPDSKPYRYVSARGRQETESLLASEFVNDFFGGSASHLVMSLLGSRGVDPSQVERLRALLEESEDDVPPHDREELK
jgi:BlaI family transcriptional regulator, penicillinase repressor